MAEDKPQTHAPEQTSLEGARVRPISEESPIRRVPLGVLVVENKRDIREMVALILKPNGGGYTVYTAENGRVALDQIYKYTIDIVLISLGMPEMNGFEFCEAVKADPYHPDLHIIIMSASEALEDKTRALELGAVDYLTKPFSRSELRARMQVGERIVRSQKELIRLASVLARMQVGGHLKELRPMASAGEEHLVLLKKGVQIWGEWRGKNPDMRPDLCGAHLHSALLRNADLTGANLRDAYLHNAHLTGANLTGANLSRARLTGANLHNANLRGANLSRADLSRADLNAAHLNAAHLSVANLRSADLSVANLSRADLSRADLSDADLSDADLSRADLSGAHLRGANLSRTKLNGTTFANVNLSETLELGSCSHRGPSTIDHRTLQQSGPLPLVFLRGCGLSDIEIEFAKLYGKNLSTSQVTDIGYKIITLRSAPSIQFYSCFISYTTADQEFAEKLYDELQENGVRCWFAPHNIQGGKKKGI